MKVVLILLSIVLTSSIGVFGQENIPAKPGDSPTVTNHKDKPTPGETPDSGLNPASPNPANLPSPRPDADKRFKNYIKSIFGPTALAKNVFSAGFNTARNRPEEWGGKWEGFGRRFASNLGKSAIKNTTIYALDEALELDSRYQRSSKKAFGSRLKNALISPVTARNKEGKRVIGIPRIAGTYTASIVAAETWFPKRFDYKDGLKSGTISLGTNALFNVVREFILK